LTVLDIVTPPLSFFLNVIFGGFLFKRIPKPSNSLSITLLSVRGFKTSNTMKIKEQVRATAITWRPRPLPSLAPSIIPGRSRIWILAPLYWMTPGTFIINNINKNINFIIFILYE